MNIGESAKDRRVLVREAGFRPTSAISVLAGTCVALGVIALTGLIAAAVTNGVGIDTEAFSRRDWRVSGSIGAAAGVLVVFAAFYFGGYTAGRMSRRMGFRHGALVFFAGAIIVAVAGLVIAGTGAWTDLRQHLSTNDVPTGSNTWSDIGIAGAIGTAVAMLLGAMFGGIKGDRWHSQLTATAERNRARAEAAPAEHEPATSTHQLGDDETMLDLRDRDHTEATEPSVEEERENARQARADVGL